MISYRFRVAGERVGAFPEIQVGNVRLGATSRLLLVPWGREQQIDLLIGTGQLNLDVALRVGWGPAHSFGVSVSARDFYLAPTLRLGAGLDLFWQPRLQLWSADSTSGLGPSRSSNAGAGGHVLVEYIDPPWLVGLRLGTKSKGLLVERPVAASFEGLLSVGVLFEP